MTIENTDKLANLRPVPRVIPRSEHNISRNNISDNALKVLYRLKTAGYQSYLVGGSVRDLLLGREPKDFDVVTNALPEQVRELFRNGRLIGRRFKLVHVRYGGEIIEVSTFRTSHHVSNVDGEGHMVEGRIVRDNVYGTIDDDVWRRDLTVNALFYNIEDYSVIDYVGGVKIEDYSVIDYVGGVKDIQSGRIRLIGDPSSRYTEDPVRLLRVVRFATKLGFVIDPTTEDPIQKLSGSLSEIPAARLFEEILKLFLGGCAVQTFEQLRHYNLFGQLFPQTEEALSEEEGGFPQTLLIHALENTDKRLADGLAVTPGFLIAAFLWAPLQREIEENLANGLRESEAIYFAADVVISRQTAITSMPRRFTQMAREIWQLQPRLKNTKGKKPERLITHPRFRAAYDFLMLRAAAGDNLHSLVEWWTKFQEDPKIREIIDKKKVSNRRKHYGRSRKSGRQ